MTLNPNDIMLGKIKTKSMYRCVNDIFGYCSETPEWIEKPHELGKGNAVTGGKCSSGYLDCGKHRLIVEQVDIDNLPESTLVETFTAPDPCIPKAKPKTKGAKKLESEIAQQGMEI